MVLKPVGRAMPQWPAALLLLIGFIVLYGALSVALGQDANWDLKNYHIYNAFQFINGRLFLDLNASGMQSFFNPLLDLPYYFLATIALPGSPRVVAFIMGANNAAMAMAVVLIVRHIASVAKLGLPFAAACVAVYIGLSGSNSISQVGTTFDDVPAGTLILYGLWFMLRPLDGEAPARPLRFEPNTVLSGVLLGVSAGLKLTGIIFAPAVVAGLLISERNLRRSIPAAAWFAVGWGCGFILAAGWWNGPIYAHTGDPFFPLFNEVFRSTWYPPTAFADDRLKPRTLAQIIAYPFFWLRARPGVVTEVSFADPRFAAAYAGIVAIVLVQGLRFFSRRTAFSQTAFRLTPSQLFMLVFLVVSYAIWQTLTSIYRHAIVIEALTGIPVLLATAAVVGAAVSPRWRPSAVSAAMIVWAVLIQLGTVYADWGRVRFGPAVLSVQSPHLPPDSLVVIAADPNAYVLPFLNGVRTRFLGVTHTTVAARGYGLWEETARRIGTHDGPIFVLERPGAAYMRPFLRDLGLTVDDAHCEPILTNLDRDIHLCSASARRILP